MYVDKPRPGKGYVIFILACLLTLLLLIVGTFVLSYIRGAHSTSLIGPGIIMAVAYAIGGGTLLLVLHAAYHTEYRLIDNQLEMKAGNLGYRKIALSQIVEIRKLSSLRRIPPGLHKSGASNRLSNLVVLRTRFDKIYLSPSDPDQFITLLTEKQALRKL